MKRLDYSIEGCRGLQDGDGRLKQRHRVAWDPGGLDISEKNDIATAELEVLQSENQRVQMLHLLTSVLQLHQVCLSSKL